MTSPIGHH